MAETLPGPEVQIVELGRAPRRLLRYRFARFEEEERGVLLWRVLSLVPGEPPPVHLPRLRQSVRTRVLRSTSAELRFEAEVGRVTPSRVEPGSSGPSEEMRAWFADWPVVRRTATMAANGFVFDEELSVPEARSATQLGVGDRAAARAWLQVVFPNEPVGVGAVWSTLRAAGGLEGIRWEEEARYRVVSLAGDRVELEIAVRQHGAEHQAMPEVPMLPRRYVESLSGSGRGRLVIHLDRFLPDSMMLADTVIRTTVASGSLPPTSPHFQTEVSLRVASEAPHSPSRRGLDRTYLP